MSGIGPSGIMNSSTADHQDSKTVRTNDIHNSSKDTLSTIRKYQNINKQETPYTVDENVSPPINKAKQG